MTSMGWSNRDLQTSAHKLLNDNGVYEEPDTWFVMPALFVKDNLMLTVCSSDGRDFVTVLKGHMMARSRSAAGKLAKVWMKDGSEWIVRVLRIAFPDESTHTPDAF